MRRSNNSCAPIWGLPARFTIADLERSMSVPTPAIEQVSVTTTSSALSLQARGIKLSCQFQNPNGSCTLELYTSDGSDVLVKSWAVGPANAVIFAGNMEFVDLAGKPIKVKVVNPQNGWVSVSVSVLD